MTDSTREHRRIPERQVAGSRIPLSLGTLLLPPGKQRTAMPLVIHFHGAPWLAEWSVRQRSSKAAVLTVNIGAGSGVYSKALADPGRFSELLDEARAAAHAKFKPVVLTSFSAGYGAVRAILNNHDNWPVIDGVLLMDSLHAGYVNNSSTGPIEVADLLAFADFSRRGHIVITHSEIYPGTFASTTETTDYLVKSLDKKRKAVLRWGPLGMQQLSQVRAGRFELMGFAGNSAPDHIDHFQAMSEWLKRFHIN